MKATYSILIFIIAISLSGCEQIVNIDVPEQETKLTCNAIAFANDTLNIFRLTKSKGVLDGLTYQFDTATGTTPLFNPVTDGEIVLYENDVPVDTLHHEIIFTAGDYPTRFIFHAESTYRIEASGGGLNPVSSITTIPFAVKPLITEYTRQSYIDNNGQIIGELQFTIDDPEEENFYRLQLFSIDSNIASNPIVFNSNDPALSVTNQIDIGQQFTGVESISFDDHLFNGLSRSIIVNLNSSYMNTGARVAVLLSTYDRSAFLYEHSLSEQSNSSGNPFSEPSSVFNNIENGYGIFGSLAVTRDTTQ